MAEMKGLSFLFLRRVWTLLRAILKGAPVFPCTQSGSFWPTLGWRGRRNRAGTPGYARSIAAPCCAGRTDAGADAVAALASPRRPSAPSTRPAPTSTNYSGVRPAKSDATKTAEKCDLFRHLTSFPYKNLKVHGFSFSSAEYIKRHLILWYILLFYFVFIKRNRENDFNRENESSGLSPTYSKL